MYSLLNIQGFHVEVCRVLFGLFLQLDFHNPLFSYVSFLASMNLMLEKVIVGFVFSLTQGALVRGFWFFRLSEGSRVNDGPAKPAGAKRLVIFELFP